MEAAPQSVLVGVTGEGENTNALRFAVDEARNAGCGVTLVHAVNPMLPPPPPSVMVTDDTWGSVGVNIVRAAHGELAGMVGEDDLPVATVVRHGDPGSVFAALSDEARLIVLQHRDMSRMHRVVSGSTVTAVAAHAHCPVVSVPATSIDPPDTGVVTAGVRGDGGPGPVLETAFSEAASRGWALRLLHGWRLPMAYDDLLADDEHWLRQDEAAINAAAADLRSKYPDVEVRVEVRHDWPADVLAGAATDSHLLVVGRHDGLPVLPVRLGSLARTAIAHARCPVMVVPL